MASHLATKIRHVDEMISRLADHRRQCDDPAEILRTGQSIDEWLDERLLLMRRPERETLRPVAAIWGRSAR